MTRKLATPRVYRGNWRFEDGTTMPVIRIATPRAFIALELDGARQVVDQVHDFADELDRELREAETNDRNPV